MFFRGIGLVFWRIRLIALFFLTGESSSSNVARRAAFLFLAGLEIGIA